MIGEAMAKRVFQTQSMKGRWCYPVTLAGETDVPGVKYTAPCVKAVQVYSPGIRAVQVYRPKASAVQGGC